MPWNRTPRPSWAEHLPPSSRGPAARRAAVAVLTAGALVGVTAFSLSPLPAQLGLTAVGCNEGKAVRQLEAALAMVLPVYYSNQVIACLAQQAA